MGFQNDYILRLIEELSALFGAIVFGESDPPQKIEEIDAALKDTLNVDPMFLFSGLNEQLESIDPKAALIVAELLFLRVKALIALNRYYESSLLSAVDFANRARIGGGLSERYAIHLLSKLLVYVTDTQTLETLLKTFENLHLFGSAEDAIFQLVKKNPSEFSKIGLAFYDRILGFDDEVLEKGGLPRTEIFDAVAELRDLA